METKKQVQELLSFIAACPTPFHVIDETEKRLKERGYTELSEAAPFSLVPGGAYYVTRNRSSVIAFRIPRGQVRGFMVSATHTDSPAFRLKNSFESDTFGTYLRLSTERYGGMIYSSWFDRPLGIAGRVTVRYGNKIVTRTVDLGDKLALIPNVAIHFNRTVNDGYHYNPAVDLLPLVGDAADKGLLLARISEMLECEKEDILSYDLSLYDGTAGTIFGLGGEFFASSRIDNLECTYAALCGFLSAEENQHAIPVFCAFDNEEVGSETKQGAASGFLSDILGRIADALGHALHELLPASFMVSADNAHAKHPNHPEFSDGMNAPDMNRGIVIKHNASQRYATDALSDGIFRMICERAAVPVQHFSNRSDILGGGTLGSISNTRVAMQTVDIGLAQLAMHSAYETAGCADFTHLINAMRVFFATSLLFSRDGEYTLA